MLSVFLPPFLQRRAEHQNENENAGTTPNENLRPQTADNAKKRWKMSR
jgi:hypothetical protein